MSVGWGVVGRGEIVGGYERVGAGVMGTHSFSSLSNSQSGLSLHSFLFSIVRQKLVGELVGWAVCILCIDIVCAYDVILYNDTIKV